MKGSTFQSETDDRSARRFGLWLFLVALGILFAASLLVVITIRLQAHGWPTDLPPLPTVLWYSTAVLLASGLALQWAVIASRCGQLGEMRISLALSFLLAVAFLVLQWIAWFDWTEAIHEVTELTDEHRMARTGFFLLTGLHAAHVIGGLVPLAIVAWYGVARGVIARQLSNTAIYWHFLDAIWIVMVLFMFWVL